MNARRRLEFEVLEELHRPLIVLVGGATGTGKSTITTEVAYRLGITRVTSTDFVRQTMRAFFSHEFMPSVHYSSFEVGQAVTVHEDETVHPNLLGFIEQTRNVLVGVKAVLERAVAEGHSMALEGVHLVPGLIPRSLEGAVVVQCLLAMTDEEQHASRFSIRDRGSGGVRPVEKYVRALPEIRRVQEYLVQRATREGVPVIENKGLEPTVESVIDLVLGAVERARPHA